MDGVALSFCQTGIVFTMDRYIPAWREREGCDTIDSLTAPHDPRRLGDPPVDCLCGTIIVGSRECFLTWPLGAILFSCCCSPPTPRRHNAELGGIYFSHHLLVELLVRRE